MLTMRRLKISINQLLNFEMAFIFEAIFFYNCQYIFHLQIQSTATTFVLQIKSKFLGTHLKTAIDL